MNLADHIREIPDFPKPGILFKDITTLIGHPQAFRNALDQFEERIKPLQADAIVAVEARGYIFGAPLADRLGLRFVPVRKPGKLPYDTISEDYELEYGSNTLEIHSDALQPGEKIVIIDDLIATGGSAGATVSLIRKLGGEVVGFACVIELAFLDGRQRLGDVPVEALLVID